MYQSLRISSQIPRRVWSDRVSIARSRSQKAKTTQLPRHRHKISRNQTKQLGLGHKNPDRRVSTHTKKEKLKCEQMRLARIPSDTQSGRGNIMPNIPKTAAAKFALHHVLSWRP